MGILMMMLEKLYRLYTDSHSVPNITVLKLVCRHTEHI